MKNAANLLLFYNYFEHSYTFLLKTTVLMEREPIVLVQLKTNNFVELKHGFL